MTSVLFAILFPWAFGVYFLLGLGAKRSRRILEQSRADGRDWPGHEESIRTIEALAQFHRWMGFLILLIWYWTRA